MDQIASVLANNHGEGELPDFELLLPDKLHYQQKACAHIA